MISKCIKFILGSRANSLRSILGLALCLSLLVPVFALADDPKTRLKAGEKKTLYVKTQKLTGTFDAGDIDDYTVNKDFTVEFGRNSVDITGQQGGGKGAKFVQWTLPRSQNGVKNPSKIVVTQSNITLEGDGGKSSDSRSISPKFEEVGGEFKIQVAMTGDVPPNLVITFLDASEISSSGAGLSIWLIALIGLLVVVLVAIGGGAGAYFYIRRRNKGQTLEKDAEAPTRQAETPRVPAEKADFTTTKKEGDQAVDLQSSKIQIVSISKPEKKGTNVISGDPTFKPARVLSPQEKTV